MGSFRSQPDLIKHTEVKNHTPFNYAVTHMCGTTPLMQAGEYIWRMPTSPEQNSQIKNTPSSACLTVTVVLPLSFRRIGLDFCGKALRLGVVI